MTHYIEFSKEYRTWARIKWKYHNQYDPTWEDFQNFFADVGAAPDDTHVLMRIEKDKPFCKDNTVWAEQTVVAPSNRREYRIWKGMKQRCLNPKSKDYPRYGGRGITICDRWVKSFHAFLVDMRGPCPAGFSIERKNVDGNYEPGNCLWADDATQANNKRNTVRVTHEGEQLSLKQFCTEYGLNYKLIHKRVTYQGWTLQMCLDTYKYNK